MTLQKISMRKKRSRLRTEQKLVLPNNIPIADQKEALGAAFLIGEWATRMALTKLHRETPSDLHKRPMSDDPVHRDALVHKELESIDTILRKDQKESRHQEAETVGPTLTSETDPDPVHMIVIKANIITKEATIVVAVIDCQTSSNMVQSSIGCHRPHRIQLVVESEMLDLEKVATHRHTSIEPWTAEAPSILDTRTNSSWKRQDLTIILTLLATTERARLITRNAMRWALKRFGEYRQSPWVA